ncbi:MAG: hypothetical protein COV34_01980 [Candidatus Zambryskibacteria bacterium CG10_big_fil_rev_8_21_14_0_10_42_12]|uniref:DUF5667 domain-containing protein n=1 Tax=Candidatus Zambryskibacteria bacterium CG10_big_fil_rev_8_21_14_0_10_42_12 TaxID=1975115 RepID=A0A2H0QX05_9BACT|nr:MAG: hypothetical protein COV34_01980 [Candidatus Zambryskibacteria bacterium CG10_big_fil_rev_8_21_14_0_10_42_12]
MTNNAKHTLHMLQDEALSADKKAAIRASLERVSSQYPLVASKQGLLSNFSVIVFMRKHTTPMIAGLLIIAFGATTTAAEGALPGDFLYPIKVNVNESIGDALAVTSRSQAEWDVRVAERRIEEAVTLAAQGALTLEIQEEIKEQFEKHVKKADALFIRIADDGDVDDVIRGRTDVEAKLKAHSELLIEASQIVDKTDSDISEILNSVGSQVTTAIEAREKAESKILTQKKDVIKESVEEKMRLAEKKIKSAQKIIDKKIDGDNGDDYVKVSEKFQSAQNYFELGKEAFDNEDYDVAFSELQKAISTAQEAETYTSGLEVINLNKKLPRNKAEYDERQDQTKTDKKDTSQNEVHEDEKSDSASTTIPLIDSDSAIDDEHEEDNRENSQSDE